MANIFYRFSSGGGDINADETMLDRPFALGPGQYHDFMTLRDFFDCVKRSVLADDGSFIAAVVAETQGRAMGAGDIEEIVIRYEKFGTLYQVCSIDVLADGSSASICASVALSEPAIETLNQEFELLERLGSTGLRYLPRPYRKERLEVSGADRKEQLLVALVEWFQGYEEWHFQRQEGASRALLWDMRGEYRFLTQGQTFSIVLQASLILTMYYEVESKRRIMPWHHGAGDFVVKPCDSEVDVRLVTARDYEPLTDCDSELEGICAFCIETLTKMRLDKREGMGESTWADYYVMQAALTGFFEGMKIKEARNEMGSLSAEGVLRELKSYDVEKLKYMAERRVFEMKQRDVSDYITVLGFMDGLIPELYAAIRSFRPEP